MITVAITSLKPLRRRFYRLFYYVHYASAWAITILIIIHARPGVVSLAFWTIIILIAQIVYRVFSQTTIESAEVAQISPTLKLVTLPRRIMPEYFPTSSHVRVSLPIRNPKAWLNPTHPYSIASLPSDLEVRLLVRESTFAIESGTKLSVTGPFSAVDSEVYANTEQTLIIAGGSGLSFAAPLYRWLEQKGGNVKLVWLVRRKSEVTALGLLEVEKADVYITNGLSKFNQHTIDNRFSKQKNGLEEEIEMNDLLEEHDDDSDGFLDELDDGFFEEPNTAVSSTNQSKTSFEEVGTDNVMSSSSKSHSSGGTPSRQNSITTLANSRGINTSGTQPSLASSLPLKGIKIRNGRADFGMISKEFFGNSVGLEKWVIACGPEGLVDTARQVATGQGLMFYGEKYSM